MVLQFIQGRFFQLTLTSSTISSPEIQLSKQIRHHHSTPGLDILQGQIFSHTTSVCRKSWHFSIASLSKSFNQRRYHFINVDIHMVTPYLVTQGSSPVSGFHWTILSTQVECYKNPAAQFFGIIWSIVIFSNYYSDIIECFGIAVLDGFNDLRIETFPLMITTTIFFYF